MGKLLIAQQTPEQRRQTKLARIRWSKGISAFVPAAPSRRAIHVYHYRYGMSCRRIAELSGLTTGEISELLRGTRGPLRDRTHPTHQVTRETELRILAVTPEEPTKSGAGARVNAVGSIRRIQGLAVIGYPLTWQSEQMDFHLRNLTALNAGDRKAVTFPTAKRIRVVYQRFEMELDPLKHGVPAKAMRLSIKIAQKHGYVAPIFWDWDVIDDPDGFPDYTGACGTVEGLRIHRRKNTKPCDACRLTANG